ncbi:MAG: dinitrogenase iron-molybdenum cofactor biosynthesis domain-containing protein [Deltaproteobacteria bacterium]|nr:dinitrogenase iron-molybdenum cofactor biosynthesis domain-containing protein [Deltaproteobacteria bacterium]
MKIAISVWEGKISPVFDTASRLLVIVIEDKKEVTRFETYFDEQALVRRCARIRILGIDVLICGAISRNFLDMLKSYGIRVIPWVCGSAEQVLDAFAEAPDGIDLETNFLMPGCSRDNSYN